MKHFTISFGFLSAFLGLVLFLGVGCNSDGNIFGFGGATGVIGIGDDVDGDGVPDSVFIDGDVIPVIPPDGPDSGCLDLNSDGTCGLDEPPILPPDDPDDPPVIIPPVDCEDPDNDGICGTTDLQPNSGILVRLISSNISDPSKGVSSASGTLSVNNGVEDLILAEASDFSGGTPLVICRLINAKVGTNEIAGLTIAGTKDDLLELEIYKGPDGIAMLTACANELDPASAGGTLACEDEILRAPGTPQSVSFSCEL